MPFKTRRQKESAASKKISISALGSVIYKSASHKKAGNGVEGHQIHKLTNEVDGHEVKSELVKIALLAGLIIGLQLALKVLHLHFLG